MYAPRTRRWFGVVLVTAAMLLAACSSAASTKRDGSSSPKGSSSTTSTNVSFDAQGTKTYGTLEVPPHKSGQRLAAALLLAGSGPTDRNGNDRRFGVSADTLQLVAKILAQEGIISLRFDKYGTGKTALGRFARDPSALTLNDYVQQAKDAYNYLRRRPEVNSHKLLIVGHSEGGMYAVLVADGVSDKPAGLALLEPQDERSLSLLYLQIVESINGYITAGMMTRSEGVKNARLVRAAIVDFRTRGSATTAGMSQPVAAIFESVVNPTDAAYEREDDRVVPANYAAKVARGTKVLVTDGTRDPNVPPSTIDPFMRALRQAHVGGPGLKLLQGTDHDMHLASQPDTQAVLAPAATAAIKDWAREFRST